jgi:hypothetical protein
MVVMQPTRVWDFSDRANLRPLDLPRHRTIHVQRQMRTPVMIILEISSPKPLQMLLVQDDHVATLLRNLISFYHQAYRTAVWSSRHNYLSASGE